MDVSKAQVLEQIQSRKNDLMDESSDIDERIEELQDELFALETRKEQIDFAVETLDELYGDMDEMMLEPDAPQQG